MKRPLTLTGGILATVGNAVMTVLSVIGFIALIPYIGELVSAGGLGVLIIAVLQLAVFVLGLIFSILALCKCNKAPAEFKKSKAIVAIVFNFIATVLCFIAGGTLNILLGLVILAGAVLFIVDLAREGKRRA